MLERISAPELTEWLAWYEVEAQDREKAQRVAEQKARSSQGRLYV